MKRVIILFFVYALFTAMHADEAHQRYVGGDISMLPQFEKYSSGYKDVTGQKINDLLRWFMSDCGWNTFRVRLFVNPQQKTPDYKKTDYAVCQDLSYVTSLGKRIKEAGAFFMLDIHYSDSWVDAVHIQAPAAWKGVSDEVMSDSISEYTHYVLRTLKSAGATPDLVQVGNEIMYGLCGIQVHPYAQAGDNWEGYLGLLRAGCSAVREECPEARIIIHTDRPTNSSYNAYYYGKLVNGGVDFDVIGLSYYPFWHGYLTAEQVVNKSDKSHLVKAINALAIDFPDKRVQIVECAYDFQYWPSEGVNYDTRDAWSCSKQGQYNFVKDLVDALKPLSNVDGISYWYPEDAGNGDNVNWTTHERMVEESWSNRGFWDENNTTSGHAINKIGDVSESTTASDICAPYYMKNFFFSPPETSGIEQIKIFTLGEKYIEEDRLIIILNGKRYSVLGIEM